MALSCIPAMAAGSIITEAQANTALEAIQAKAGSDVEVSLLDGGQPIYYFMLSVE